MISRTHAETRDTIESRLMAALDWWRDTHPNQTTSSVAGTGAIIELETWFAKRVDHVAGFAVGSGTQALIAGLLALGIGRGSQVALPAYDWTAALAATLSVGAEPLWCDVGPNGVITPATVQQLARSPDLIVATSLHGYPVDVRRIRCVMPDVPILEDCSQALGALRDGTPAGTHADVAVWSLGHRKFLDAGEGGILTTHHRHLAEEVLTVTQHPLRQAISGASPSYLATIARMHPAAAILAVAQLDSIDSKLGITRIEDQEKLEQARRCGIRIPELEPSVSTSAGTVVAFERHERSGPGFRVLSPLYPVAPPSLVGQRCTPMAALWTLHGRRVSFDTQQ